MKQLKCETCGASLVLSEDGLHAHCEVCGNVYEYRNPKEEYIIEQLNEANDLRQMMDFDDAIKKYRIVLKSNAEDAEAHFGMLLAKYGVAYEIDPFTEEYIPTFHRNMRGNIADDENAKCAIEYATDKQKDIYKNQIAELRRIQEGIEKVASECKPYDVFVSFKATDENDANTIDRDIAYNIYDELNSRNIRTFFSEVSLMDMASSDYEAVIFNALNTCKVFILVGTSKENINSTWVKNEWTRFREIVAEDMKNGVRAPQHFAVVGTDMKIHDLPLIFAKTQNIMLSKYAGDSYKKDVALSVEKILGINKGGKSDLKAKIDNKTTNMVNDEAISKSKNRVNPNVTYEHLSLAKGRPEGVYAKAKDLDAIFVEIDDYYNGEPVIGILKNGFKNAKMRQLKLPNTLTYILDSAFAGCQNLRKVEIPDSILKIDNEAFARCAKLKEIKFPSSLVEMCANAFANTSISEVDLSKTKLTTIGLNLEPDNKVRRVVLPPTIEEIDAYAFLNIPLEELIIPNDGNLECIGSGAFKNTKLKRVELPKSLVTIGDGAFEDVATLEEVIMPNDGKLESIGNSAFKNTILKEIVLPKNIKSIGDSAFEDVKTLEKFETGESELTTIGDNAFRNTIIRVLDLSHTKIEVLGKLYGEPIDRDKYSYTEYENLKFTRCRLEEIKLPSTLMQIADQALSEAKLLTKVDIPEEAPLTTIGEDAFASSLITEITLPKSLVSIGNNAFYETKIREIKLPDGLETIGDWAFSHCKNLSKIYIPSSVTHVGSFAFCFGNNKLTINIATKSQTKTWKKYWKDSGSILRPFKINYFRK